MRTEAETRDEECGGSRGVGGRIEQGNIDDVPLDGMATAVLIDPSPSPTEDQPTKKCPVQHI